VNLSDFIILGRKCCTDISESQEALPD